MRREGPNGVRRAGQVDVDRDMPVRILHLEERMEALDASIWEQDVDAPEFLFASDGGCSQCGQVALVELDVEPATPGRPD
jgi:hypothetical protein